MMKKTVTSLNLAVMLLGVNIVVSLVSFTTCTNYQQVYAQSIDDANTNDDDDDNNNKNSISFTKPINLSNNKRDSVYAQIASYGKNVYMVWQENNPDPFGYNNNANNNIQYNNNYRNYDIYMKKSTDGGSTFSKEINLSKNPGFSEHPQIAISENNVYVAWIDESTTTTTTTKNQEILFRKSIDGGNTFDKIINLSNSSNADSYNLEITAAGNNVYAVWQDTTLPTADYNTGSSGGVNADNNSDRSSISSSKENSSILFRASTDDGNTFKKIKSLSNSAFKSYPKIAAFENSAYVVWNVGIVDDSNREVNNANNINDGIFFTKSFDSGNSFSDTIKLNSDQNSIGESQIAAYGNNVYVVWGGNPDEKIVGDIFFVKSSDNGNRFAKAVSLGEQNSLNVEIISGENNNVYIAWQALLSDGNEEILFKKSSDNGASFTNINENISKNEGISECTSMAVSQNNNIYVAWEDYTYGNHEILFAKSI
jgi:hypothetical protein